MTTSQGAKWIYLTWDAAKGFLVSFCSVASTYQILTAQPENYVAGIKLLPFSHFMISGFVNFVDIFRNSFFFKYYTFKQSL